jgi:hypothetical protein
MTSKNFDVKVTWGLPGSSLSRTTVVKTMATTEEIALSVAKRSVRFEHIPKEAEIRSVKI